MTKKILMDNSDSEGHPTLHPFQFLDQPVAVLTLKIIIVATNIRALMLVATMIRATFRKVWHHRLGFLVLS